jgi:energy-coupling factor transporter ATP-binding protein EcfA2
MALLEILIAQVAPPIAKSILRFWLQDKEWAEDITSGFVDLINVKTNDVRARQAGRRQFEAIGEKVAEELLVVFEQEGDRFDEATHTALALALARTLSSTPLDPGLLAEQNLDPNRLAQHLLSFAKEEIRLFSTDEVILYRRLVQETSKYIVDIASQLPTFTERTFAEVLKRQDTLRDIAETILAEVRHIRAISRQANPELASAVFEKEYREAVARNLDRLELFGVDVSGANKRHRLSVAYVTLAVTTENKPLDRSSLTNNADTGLEDDVRVTMQADAALAKARRVLLRGQAGSGKTTLLQWLAVNSARQSFENELDGWNSSVPFFVRLREFVEQRLPTPNELPRFVAPSAAENVPEGWVRERLKSGQALLLIDGVDEVPEAQRGIIRTWLADLVGSFPDPFYIITSRPSAVEADWLAQEGFAEAELQAMELPDIDAFVEHWHDAVREELQDEAEKVELSSYAADLKVTIRKSRALRSLATSPLLCAMLCALHRDRRRQLPSDRIELYRAGCEMLLERRDKERGIEATGYPSLSYRQKLVLLQDLAYWLMENGWSMVSLERAAHALERKLPNIQSMPENTGGADVLRLFIDRNGMLRVPVVGQVDFTHRTFQEYLAAQEALARSNIGVLIKSAHDDQWRETIILAAGLAKPSEREELIRGLLERGDREVERRYQLHLLAVACLETSVELGMDVRAAVETRLAAIVPPKTMADAKALAAAGELAVPYLGRKQSYKAGVAAACVRALTLIGGDAALDVLASYGDDQRETVKEQLLRGLMTFDSDEYVPRVLGRWNELSFAYQEISEVALLRRATHLTSLYLQNTQVADLSSLAGLVNLTKLGLGETLVADLSPLTSLIKLSQLYLGSTRVVDLSPLAGLTSLTKLILTGTLVTDLSPLAGLVNLAELYLGNTRVADLSPLAGLVNLTDLNLYSVPVADISPLAGLVNLSGLQLGNTRVVDLSPLAGLTSLTRLDLSNTRVADLSPLAGLTSLTHLDLNNTRVTDLSPLAGLTSLATLRLRGTPINDLAPLTKLPALREVLPPRHMIASKIPAELRGKVQGY